MPFWEFPPSARDGEIARRSGPPTTIRSGMSRSRITLETESDLNRRTQRSRRFTYTSPQRHPPAQTLVAFIISVVAGTRRLAHTDWLRADKALHALLGIERFPGTDTVRNLFSRFRQGHIEAFW